MSDESEIIETQLAVSEGQTNCILDIHTDTGCPKSHAPSLKRYIFRYEISIAIKVCLDRVTLYNFVDTKHDPVNDLVTY